MTRSAIATHSANDHGEHRNDADFTKSQCTEEKSTKDQSTTYHTATLVEAVNLALARAMRNNDDVVTLGEDIGRNGGVFRATVDLRETFGVRRVMDTPLAETLIAGITIGMAA